MAAEEPSTNKRLYGAWISPSVAIERIKRPDLHFETAARTIGERLRAGLVSAIAKVSTDPMLTRPQTYVIVGPDVWRHWAPLQDYDFWRTGDVEISKSGTTGYGDDEHLVTLFGIRLCPEDIQEIAPHPGVPGPRASQDAQPSADEGDDRTDKSPLPDATLEDWAALFNKANPGASEASARKAVEAMFPRNHVTRARLRRVLPERTPGRPLKSKDK